MASNYHPLPVVLSHAEGAWVTDVEGRRYLDMLAGYSALNFGHLHPALVGAARDPARAADADEPRLPQRPARPLLPRPRDARGQGPRAADEHRRRGRRDGDQDGPALGLRGQGRPGRSGSDRRHGRQLPRPHDDDHQLLRRPGRARPLRPLHAGLRHGAVRRHRGARGRDHRRHRRRSARADPGRGRRHHPARRLAARRARADPAPERAHGRRRDPVGSGAHRHDLRVRRRGGRARRLRARQGARRRHRPGLGRRREP